MSLAPACAIESVQISGSLYSSYAGGRSNSGVCMAVIHRNCSIVLTNIYISFSAAISSVGLELAVCAR